jgi:2-oxoglutarate dehydrogenase E1 component
LRINASDALTTPETLINACRFMINYWKTYKKDILIDMIGYRKHGHFEVDKPSFTQPQMYDVISDMNSLPYEYAQRLIQEQVITQ